VSKNINVNPGQYKVRGRERQGEDVLTSLERQSFERARGPRGRGRGRRAGTGGRAAKARRSSGSARR
jgi:hypothetical protein